MKVENFPKPFQEFAHIKRYWDTQQQSIAAKILPGEFYITNQNEVITTILGSCISVCIRDIKNKIGGMNHFMLPIDGANPNAKNSEAARYGNWAMEYLINSLLKRGSYKNRFEIKIFGGGNVMTSMPDSNIGEKNILFTEKYFSQEGLDIESKDVGGNLGRKVIYFPMTGKVLIKKLQPSSNESISEDERYYSQSIRAEGDISGDIELF